ncbi:MFS transporter, partial [Treponema phagedenis]|uniref:MFS transporter n=1 Tax=Treponema phagedenis TaxID=162 RepID=UPI0018DEE898
MNIGIVYCLFFLIYGLINTYLALLLRSMGYDSGEIGLLLGVFETAGAVLPLLVSAKIDTNGKYGLALVLLGIISATALLPLISFSFIILTVVCLCLFALGTKGAVPLLDSFTAKRLGDKSSDYGKIRALGSLGFVSMTLFLQFTSVIRQDNIASIIIGFAVSGSIFTCSLSITSEYFTP